MEFGTLIFLTSGLFLGWSLGANDAANVFGTAVGTRMVRFNTAVILCSIFVVVGAVFGGAGGAETLGKLGAIDTLAGSFMAALAAGIAVYLMIKSGLPVSTTQAIVGGIVGWNLFSGTPTDSETLGKILSTWVLCPILAAIFSASLMQVTRFVLRRSKLHRLRQDAYTRIGLILAGVFGAYSLGANNIANVVGVFVPASPFKDIALPGNIIASGTHQLFFLGALAISVGVLTYSRRVMMTVGKGLLPLTPVGAWVVVVSHSMVLFIFSSTGLSNFLTSLGLPAIPLVPVSSSQAVVGAVLGIGMLRGGRAIQWSLLGRIALGWVTTPVIAGLICFVGLFFLQNVFGQPVQQAGSTRYAPKNHATTEPLPLKSSGRFNSPSGEHNVVHLTLRFDPVQPTDPDVMIDTEGRL